MLTLNQLTKLDSELNNNVNNNYSHINAGGCGYIAYNIAKRLRERGIDAGVVFVNHSYASRKGIDLTIEREDVADINELILHADYQIRTGHFEATNLIDNTHICVQVGNELYDSTGNVSGKFEATTDPINDKAMNVLLRQRHFWNPSFRDAENNMDDLSADIVMSVDFALAV